MLTALSYILINLRAQARAEQEAAEAAVAAAYARANVVYEDKPLSARTYFSETSLDTEQEVALPARPGGRDPIVLEISRPKRNLNLNYRFIDRNADVSGLVEFRAVKDPAFIAVKENDIGLQAAPALSVSSSQTNWYRSTNKASQYEPLPPSNPEATPR